MLDAHPALRLHSVSFRRASATSESPCTFAFPAPGSGPPLPAFADAPGAESAGCPLAFRLDPFTDYGSSLTVTLPPEVQAHQPFQVILRYTSTDAPAIWWLDPELTYGNAKPFVFTQGHSVCNRSFFPCFDTPAVKCTYSAVVKVRTSVGVVSAFPGHCPRPDLTAGLHMGSGYPLLYSSCLPTLGSQLRSRTVTQRSQRQALRRPGKGTRVQHG